MNTHLNKEEQELKTGEGINRSGRVKEGSKEHEYALSIFYLTMNTEY
jgi:hypothetical protein